MLGSAGPACARAPPPSRPASERYPPPLPGETRRPVTQQQAWPNQARGPPGPARRCPPRAQCQAGRAGPAPGDGERAHWPPPRPPARIWGSPRCGGRGAGPRGAAGHTACKPTAGWGEARAGHRPIPPPPRPALSGEDGHLGWAGNRGCASRASTPPGRYAGVGLVKTGTERSPPRGDLGVLTPRRQGLFAPPHPHPTPKQDSGILKEKLRIPHSSEKDPAS